MFLELETGIMSKIHNKVCELDTCGKEFTSKRVNAMWCSNACRKKARYLDNKSGTYRGKGLEAKSGKLCTRCGQDRGPNYSICRTCVNSRPELERHCEYV